MDIEKKFIETIKKYKLLNKKDKVVVAMSGGKDSIAVLYLLKKFEYKVQALMIDLNFGKWSEKNLNNAKLFCNQIDVKLKVVNVKKELKYEMDLIQKILKNKKNLSRCYVCGIIKKWLLNKWARKLKADKIATGHNLDDECQSVLMNFLKGNISNGINTGPKTGGNNKLNFIQRIKPLFYIPENEIKKYIEKKQFNILYKKCPYAVETYRVEIRNWMKSISDNEKLKVVSGWQKVIPKLKIKKIKKIQKCNICKEFCSGDICSACKIIKECI